MIGRTLGRYRIVARLGEGGMSTVWRAEDPLLDRRVALKVLSPALSESPEARRRFQREGELAQLLDHPAIVPVLDSSESDGLAWLVMSLVEGETLAERMQKGLLPVVESRDIAAVIAAALGYAHARGILHRDVSPRNIMQAVDGRVFLMDFGLALVEGASRVTRSGVAPGTLAYMAPEALSGSGADPRSDLYSLAAVLYEMVTGSPPHSGDSAESLLYARLNVTPRQASELRPGIPAGLDALLARGLEREPAARFADAEEFLAALRAVDSTASAQPLFTPPQARSAGELLTAGEGVVYLGVPEFEVRSDEDPALSELAQALADALRRRLGGVRRVHVVQSADPLGMDGDAREWANRHGANLVLQGRAVRHGARIRVECTLFDPEGGVSLAGGVVEGSLFDPFDLEDRLVSETRALFPVLHGELIERRAPGLETAGADDRFAQALRYLQRHDHEPSVDAAIGLLERIVASRPDQAEYHAALARAYLAKYALTRQHAWEGRAATIVERATRLDASLPSVRLALADLKAVAGRGTEAWELYRQALAEAPENLEGWLGLAQLNERHGNFAEAENACRRAIALRPRDWRGYNILGIVYFRQGRYGLAVSPLRRVLRLSPDHARAASNLAAVLFHLERFEESETALRRSLEIEPTAATYANLGTVLYSRHRFDGAVEAFTRACDLRPAQPSFWGYLASAARQVPGMEEHARRALERAIGLMREALERNPEDPESWAIFAGWLAAQGQRDESRAAIERALAMAPRYMRCIIEATHTYTLLGEYDTALDHLERAILAGYGLREIESSVELRPLRELERYRQLVTGAARTRR